MSDGSPRYVGGINAVREALRSAEPPQKVLVRQGLGPRHREILDLARRLHVPVSTSTDDRLDALCPGGHQGVVALVASLREMDLDAVPLGPDTLLVAVDGVTDPMNLGAILRSAEGAGAAAVLLPKRRTASPGPTVARASAGALAHVPLVRVSSLADALLRLHRAGVAVIGLDATGARIWERSGVVRWPLVVVVGEEGAGLHHLVRERCDELLAIPLRGKVTSLNASVACGIALFELRRARQAGEETGRR